MNNEPIHQPVSIHIVLIALMDIVENLKLQRNSREVSLAITKLQETIFWLREAVNGG